jgi:hypothetical protein
MLRTLLLPEGDARQQVRMRRFLLASATYAITVPLLLLAYLFKLIALAPALWLIAAMAAINAALYGVFRLGLNERFRDPSLTWLQIFVANIVLMCGAYSFNQGRARVHLDHAADSRRLRAGDQSAHVPEAGHGQRLPRMVPVGGPGGGPAPVRGRGRQDQRAAPAPALEQ